MNHTYFALLNLEEAITLNDVDLKKAYFKAQQQCHPDRARTNVQKLEFLQLSADVNQAYHTLKDFASRLNYILKLRGTDIDGEDAPNAPPSLLMESMEWREQWAACHDDNAKTAFQNMLDNKIEQYKNAAISAYKQNDLTAMVEAALYLRYLTRMKEEISQR